MDEDEALILRFMQAQPMAVLSTVAPQSLQPESALTAFTQTDRLEIIFESFVNTRKWHNLQKNRQVALVIGWDIRHHITVQYEGTAVPIPAFEAESYIQIFLEKDTPCTEKFLRDRRVQLYKVRPSWVRYSDYTGDGPPKIIEKVVIGT